MERNSSTDYSVAEAEAAVAVEAAAMVAGEVADPVPLCRLGKGSLKSLPPAMHLTTTMAAAASATVEEEGAAEARGGGKIQQQPFVAIQESLVC